MNVSKQAIAPTVMTDHIARMITGFQIRAARALLNWSAQQLADAAGVSYPTIQRAEQSPGIPNMQSKNLFALKGALESAGVLFLDSGEVRDGGPGVRLKVR